MQSLKGVQFINRYRLFCLLHQTQSKLLLSKLFNPTLLGIELLNELSTSAIPLDTLVSYKTGYEIIWSYSNIAENQGWRLTGASRGLPRPQEKLGDARRSLQRDYAWSVSLPRRSRVEARVKRPRAPRRGKRCRCIHRRWRRAPRWHRNRRFGRLERRREFILVGSHVQRSGGKRI
jgi:hypothetical protein